MRNMKIRLVSLALAATMLVALGSVSVGAAESKKIIITIDGVVLTTKVAPIAQDGKVLVPSDIIGQTLGALVKKEAAGQRVTVTNTAHSVVFNGGSKAYVIDGTYKISEINAKRVDTTLLVPLDTFLDGLGIKYTYDKASGNIKINYFTGLTGNLKIDGSTTLQPVAQAAADRLMAANKGLSISVNGGGSGTGIKDAAAGTVNIGMSSRELTADELKNLNAYAVANDGIAIIVNPNNPVASLTKEQAAKIFLGEIKNWKDVGGANAPIIVATRETGSGTRSTLEELLLEKKSVVDRATPYTSSALIKQAVAKDKNAIGYDSIGFVDNSVKALDLDKVAAGKASVLSHKYGMGRELYCATKGAASGLSAVFIDYLRSIGVQSEIVETEGYIKLY